MKGRIGASTGQFARAIPIRTSLVESMRQETERKEPKPVRVFHGPKAMRPNRYKRWTDEQVLQVRALHQFCGMKPIQLAEFVGMDRRDVLYMLAYRTRQHLEPTQQHADAALAVHGAATTSTTEAA